MNIFIINGPNLNMLGIREKNIYGTRSYEDLVCFIRSTCRELGVQVSFFQSNHEGALVDAIQSAYGRFDGIVLNPAAYTHTSIALLDAVAAVNIPTVEVHLTDVRTREAFRRVSYVSQACIKTISGLGFEGYRQAILTLMEYKGRD